MERASRQNKAQCVVAISLLLVILSVFAVLSLSPSSLALSDLKTSIVSSEPRVQDVIKRTATPRVSIASSLFDKTTKIAPILTSEATSDRPTRPSASQQSNSTSSKDKSEKPLDTQDGARGAQFVSAPAIAHWQSADLDRLQFVGTPYYGGNGRLISAPAAQVAATSAVLEPTEEGWKIFGTAWFWWLAPTAVLAAAVWWRDKLFQFTLFGYQKWQFLLRPKR